MRILKLLALAAVSALPFLASAQIALTNGVQRYASLAGATANLSGKCEVWVTNSTTPLAGCTINLNSLDAWLFLPGIKPSVVVSTYLSQIKVNSATAVADSNVRVVQYGQSGAVIIPQPSTFQPLTVFKDPQFGGTSTAYNQWTYYTGSGIGGFSSFKLKRGYQVVFAQSADGKNYSRCYVAQDGDLEIGVLPTTLSQQVQFIYVTPWRWTSKKGISGDPGIGSLNLLWWYNWNISSSSSRDLEYVAIRQNQYWPGLGQNWRSLGINTVLGYNEPDQANQANMSVATAISAWGDLLGTGLRVGSPATSDGGPSSWLFPFISQADAAGLRVDFVAQHYYQAHNPADAAGCASQMYNFLLNIWNNTHRPIWVTEWNNGANWTDGQWPVPTYAQQQADIAAMVNMLESTPFVERYALYNWVEDGRSLVNGAGAVTLAGTVYSNTVSGISYSQAMPDNGTRGIAQFLFETNTLDTSGYCNNAMTASAPAYTAGHSGEAIVLDGANNYLQLPANIAKAGAFTFAAWIYWNGGANWQRIFDFGNDTSHYMFLSPSSGSGTLRFAINNGGGEQTIETGALTAGAWQHVAITLSGNTAILYVNGTPVATSTSFSIAPSAFSPIKNYLGKGQFPADPLFNGLLDEVEIADYAMTPAQISALVTTVPSPVSPYASGLWTSDADGIWSDTNNWNGGQIANGGNGVNYNADFSTLNITADRTVTLDSSRGIGTLRFGDISGVQNWTLAGSSTLTLAAGSGNIPAIAVNQNTATISAPLAGSQGFVKSGLGALVLGGSSSPSGTVYIDTGSTTVPDGSVRASSPGALASASAIQIRNNASSSSTLQLDGSAGNISMPNISLSGRNVPVKAIENIAGTNTLSGGITLNTGGVNYIIQSDAGVLILGGTTAFSSAGARNVTFQGVGAVNVNGTLADGSGTMSLIKTGTGTLMLSSAATYSGTTIVNGGTLLINGTTGPGAMGIANASTLGGTGSIGGSVTVQSGGMLSPGTSVGILTARSNVTLNAGSTTFMEINKSPLTNDQFGVTGGLTYGGTLVVTNLAGTLVLGDSFDLFNAAGSVGTFTSSNLPALDPGLAWSFNPVSGVLSVISTSDTPPTISSIANQTVNENTATAALALTVGDAETPAASLALSGTSSNPALVPAGNIQFGGSGSSRTITILPGANQYGSATITLAVSDGSLVTTTTFVLTVNFVNQPPFISSIPDQTGNKNIPLGPLPLTIGDPDTAAASLTLSATSSNPALVPVGNILFGGSGANRSVTITPLPEQAGTSTITIKVSDGSLTASNSFNFTINTFAMISKADNTIALNSGSSWTGGAAPDANAIGIWDSTVTSANAVALGANASWSGVTIINPAGPVIITAGNTLTLGASGINMSGASQNLNILSGLTLAPGNQTWNVVSGRTLTVGGTFARSVGATLVKGSASVATSSQGTVACSPALVNGVAPWADVLGAGTAANNVAAGYNFATVTSGQMVPYTGATPEATAGSAWGGIPSGGTGTVNYDISISGTPGQTGLNRNINTLRYTGTGLVQQGNNTALLLNVNAILNAGSGTLALATGGGSLYGIAPSDTTLNELILAAASSDITVNAYIANNVNPAKVTITGPNTVTLSGANTFTGNMNVNGGTLVAANGANTGIRTSSPFGNATTAGRTVTINYGAAVSLTVGNVLGGGGSTTAPPLSFIVNAGGRLQTAAGDVGGPGSGDANIFGPITLNGGTLTTGNGYDADWQSAILLGNITVGGSTPSTINTATANTLANGLMLGAASSGTHAIIFNVADVTGDANADLTVLARLTDSASSATAPANVGALTKTGAGTMVLYGANTYTGPTSVSAGKLLVNGSTSTGSVPVYSGGTLGGNGILGGPVTVQSGGTLAPGGSIGTLTANNNVSLQAGSTTLMEINKTPPANDQLAVAGLLTYGGTLVVTNLAGTLAAGDSFQLFNAGSNASAFASTNLPVLDSGLAWNFNAASGVLSVISTVATNPTNLSYTLGEGSLTLSWPSDHTGWRLQVQTNAPDAGLGTNWVDVAGSSLTNSVGFPVDATEGSIFYRLVY